MSGWRRSRDAATFEPPGRKGPRPSQTSQNGTRISRMNTDFIAGIIESQMRCWFRDAIEAFGLSMLAAGTVC